MQQEKAENGPASGQGREGKGGMRERTGIKGKGGRGCKDDEAALRRMVGEQREAEQSEGLDEGVKQKMSDEWGRGRVGQENGREQIPEKNGEWRGEADPQSSPSPPAACLSLRRHSPGRPALPPPRSPARALSQQDRRPQDHRSQRQESRVQQRGEGQGRP